MINLIDIPIWTLVILNVAVAVAFWALCARLSRSAAGRVRAAVALTVAYTGIGLRAAVSAGSARVTLIIAAEAILALMLGVFPFIGYIKTEIAAQKEGRAVEQSRSNVMAMRLVGALLGLLAVFLGLDAVAIHGFFGTHG
jgi:ABC-type enterochelin transport system permease subunit